MSSSQKSSDSMASLITSLTDSFRKVPLSAIPAMLDCILASTSGLSPLSLFDKLLDTFPSLTEEYEKLGSDECCYLVSLAAALCHLVKKMGSNHDSLRLFLWRSFIPLMKMAHELDRGLLNQIAELFIDAVIETNSWRILEEELVPYLLRSIGNSLGMSEKESLNVFHWGGLIASQCPRSHLTDPKLDKGPLTSSSGSFPLSVSCQILTFLVDATLRNHQGNLTYESVPENGSRYVEIFSGNLVWDLCNLAEHMLSQSSEHRSCTIVFLLPTIFKMFVGHCSFEVSIQGHTRIFSRSCVFRKIWKCCKTLFSVGPLERRDAYSILSLYTSFFTCKREDTDMIDKAEETDIMSDIEFWEEIKKGLVDKETLIRKQSLQILKTALNISGEIQVSSDTSEINSSKKDLNPSGMTKRDFWADKEAKSLGVGRICSSVNPVLNCQQQWEAFVLSYEMLEEYGTHLVEAAWNHQVSLLLQYCVSDGEFSRSCSEEFRGNQGKTSREIFDWLPVLWVRGFNHDNPLVRSLIMQSFAGIDWKNYGSFAKTVPEAFVCGPFIQALNDPIHHDDFGSKGLYSSRTTEGASHFLHDYARHLDPRRQVAFLTNLASLAKKQSFGRAGLMSLAECLASAACGIKMYQDDEPNSCEIASSKKSQVDLFSNKGSSTDIIELIESLRFVVESSKQHFNPSYRLRVCEKALHAAVSMSRVSDVPLKVILHFISAFPREFTDVGGFLRKNVQEWLLERGEKEDDSNCCVTEIKILKGLHDFPKTFASHYYSADPLVAYDDEDLDLWESEAKIWARVLFLIVKEENHLAPIMKLIQDVGSNLCNQKSQLEWVPVKFLILMLSLVQELQIVEERTAAYYGETKTKLEGGLDLSGDEVIFAKASSIYEKFANVLCFILDELISFANVSCSIFWSGNFDEDNSLPGSVRGKLGGPSQRRLPSLTTSAVLRAIMAVKTVAVISSWCTRFKSDSALTSACTFMWKFLQKTISSPLCDSHVGAEIYLAACEALASALRALASGFCSSALNLVKQDSKFFSTEVNGAAILDSLVCSFLQNINSLLATGALVRTRQAVLMNWKWHCLESLLSFPYRAVENGYRLEDRATFFSGDVLKSVFSDLVESLENAGEGSILSMLRSVRLVLGLSPPGRLSLGVSSCDILDDQMIWDLVRSSWILHVNCNKRRVAPISALLSSILHFSIFGEENMHVTDGEPGPLKWFVEKVLEEGTKSPRTIRLAALHLTGLWFRYPQTIKYYMKELKLLSLYGSVAFDEDFEGELTGNCDARAEVLLLAQSPDPELTDAFINTDLYARVSVAVLFYKLSDIVGSADDDRCRDATEAGKLFLLQLLDSVVNDKDLSKELYKKYSAIHRRKIRAWQMICVLSRFVSEDILGHVTQCLHLALCRNNLPAVRQYLETFAINTFLKFPAMVGEQLVPILRDYNTKPQALSSYVFIAANVILHSSESVLSRHLNDLLPPIVPLLTSHHHSLRGFTQLLIHHVLSKLYPSSKSSISDTVPLERKCFEDLKLYLAMNPDCTRLRASMEGYLDAYNPHTSVTPAGIFINRVEELEFECVPTSLMDHVLNFLNDAREDLRSSMAKDIVTIKNESLRVAGDSKLTDNLSSVDSEILQSQSLDFQKKITPLKHEKHDSSSTPLFNIIDTYHQLAEMEKEDQLFDQLFYSRTAAMEKARGSRQSFILVASLLDRIPNLAGLARTCEVFKASGLAIADSTVLRDKQFQLISVTAEKWVPIIEVPVNSVKMFLEKKKQEGFSILGLEQTANSIPLDQYAFPKKTVLVLGREKEGIPVDIIHILDACIEIPQLGVVRSLNVHVSGAIALWEYTRQQRTH